MDCIIFYLVGRLYDSVQPEMEVGDDKDQDVHTHVYHRLCRDKPSRNVRNWLCDRLDTGSESVPKTKGICD